VLNVRPADNVLVWVLMPIFDTDADADADVDVDDVHSSYCALYFSVVKSQGRHKFGKKKIHSNRWKDLQKKKKSE
jgi:hypothetical protein